MKYKIFVNNEEYCRGSLDNNCIITAVEGDHQVSFIRNGDELHVDLSHFKYTRCSFCYQPRVEVKKGFWICPGMEGSPTHGYGCQSAEDNGELGLKKLETFLATKNCTLEEYRQAS